VTKPGWIQYTSWFVQLLPLAGVLLLQSYVALALLFLYVPIFIFDKKLDELYGVLRAVGRPSE
jgi:hypothetical protein